MSDHDDHFMTVNVREMHRFTQACKSVAKLLSEDHVSWEKRDREKAIVAATLKMFVAEKVQSYWSMMRSTEVQLNVINEISKIVAEVFQIDKVIDLTPFVKQRDRKIETKTKLTKE